MKGRVWKGGLAMGRSKSEDMSDAGIGGFALTKSKMWRALALFTAVAAICIGPIAADADEAPQDTAANSAAELASPKAAAASRGLTFAKASCASCHAVDAGQAASPYADAPTFESIANSPGMTKLALDAFLHTSHSTMPNLIIESATIEDLWAYLETLKTPD
jgi:mono/diheme cytochrome c family protein